MMGDKDDAPTGVTAGELAAVLQAMDEKYKLLFEAMSKQGGSSKPEAEVKEDSSIANAPGEVRWV